MSEEGVRNSNGEVLKEKIRERLVQDGYALINNKLCSYDSLREKVGRCISDLEVNHNLPATFVLLFDQTWTLAAESHNLLLRSNEQSQNRGILQHAKNMAFNFDMLAWHIDPRLDQSGFSPHRDRQPDSLSALKQSFYSDGQAKYVTHWIALTDANPENSCLYVIPKEYDPGYMEGDNDPPEEEGSGENEQFSDPLSRALNTKQSYQNIRALPREEGQSLIFTHRIMHWGSRGNKNALGVQPRIAISFVYSDTDFEAPYLSEESFAEDDNGKWQIPPFSVRLLLVCSQLLIYYQRFDLSTATIRACYDYCKTNAHKLHDAYRKKVFVEFVKAMKERRDGIANGSANDNEEAVDAESEDEEALLEEMLNHSDAFEDDYDETMQNDDDTMHNDNAKKRKIE